MPSILQRKRERQLRMLADSLLLEEEQAEQHRQAVRETGAFQKAQKAQRLKDARAAEAAYLAGAEEFEGGLRLAAAGFRKMLEALPPLHMIPAGAMVAGKDAVTTRASRFVSAMLFSMTRNSAHFGQVRHHYTGRPSPNDCFVDDGRDMIARIFPKTNGAAKDDKSKPEN